MHRFMLAVCLLALAACSPGTASSADQLQATAAATATQALPPTFTPAPQPTSTPQSTAFDKPGKIGQRLENGGTALTILTTTLTTQLDPATPAKAGEAYLVADVLVENVGTDPVAYDVIFFSVLDAGSVEYNQVLGAPAPALTSGELPPGGRVQGQVAFKIKSTASGLVIKYQPVVMGPSPRIYIAVP
jgi:hypothetical protein